MGHGDAVQTGLVRPGLLEPGSAGLASKLIVPPSCDMGHGGGRAGTVVVMVVVVTVRMARFYAVVT